MRRDTEPRIASPVENGAGDRRSFLRVGLSGLGASLVLGWSAGAREGRAQDASSRRTVVESEEGPWTKARARSCILVWLGGGPSQLETWDPKPEHRNGGPTRAIEAADGLRIAEHFPRVAEAGDELCLLRSVTSPEGDHGRASYFLHTGYKQIAALTHPSLGAIVARERGRDDAELPHFVSVGGGSYGPGYLGVRHGPFTVRDPRRPVPYLERPEGVDTGRFRNRMRLLGTLDRSWLRDKRGEFLSGHRSVRHRTIALLDSPAADVFDVRQEPEEVKERFGGTPFGLQALLAARLVEHGVPFVEIHHGGWDTHSDNFASVAQRSSTLDPALGGLLGELRGRGLLESTLVAVTGEFGRTPRINRNVGRDHFPHCFSVLLAGGGARGGTAIGRSSPDGTEVADRPIPVADLYATLLCMLGIDPAKEVRTAIGRSIELTDEGRPVTEAFL